MTAGPSAANSAWDVFGDYLLPNEQVLSFGRPDPNTMFTLYDLYLIPFSLMWGGFAIAWEILVIAELASGETRSGNGGSLWMFAVGGLIFVAAGVYMIFGRFIYKRFMKLRTYYAVTDRKVIALTRFRRDNARAQFVDEMASVRKSVRKNGIGTIQFGDPPGPFTPYGNTGLDFFMGARKGDRTPVAFYDVHQADDVYRLIEELRTK